MCFSAEASFIGGVVISAIGVATITKITNPSQIVFASIPLFFGIQQIAEGFLWISLPYPEYILVQKISAYWFLIMAEVLWPLIIPFSLLFMEQNAKRKNILYFLLGVGSVLSLYYGSCLIFLSISPEISSYHIQYNSTFPEHFALPAFLLYLVVTITPLFISSGKRIYILGILMFLSCVITTIFFAQYLTSVWCFFGAVVSGVIFWILRESKIKFNFDKLKNGLKSFESR